jgi:hypothetical protein
MYVPGGHCLGGLLRAGAGRFPGDDAERIAIGEGVPVAIGSATTQHGSPADEHVIQPKDADHGRDRHVVAAGVRRSIAFHCRSSTAHDDAYFAPLVELKLRPETELYLSLVHREGMTGNAARLAAARRHARVDGVATECGIARGDPARFPGPLAAHVQTAELGAPV